MAGSAVSQSDHRSVFHTLKRRLPFGQFCQRNRDWADGLLARRYAEADREIPMIVGNARRQRERQALQQNLAGIPYQHGTQWLYAEVRPVAWNRGESVAPP